MNDLPWRTRFLQSTRGQILTLLRAQDRTVDELATQLQLTDNAVRAHLVSLERDSFVRQIGTRAGTRKPHALYAVTPAVEAFFPKPYGPLLDLVLVSVSRRLATPDLRRAMREVGRKIAAQMSLNLTGKTRKQRINAAVKVLGELGGTASVENVNGNDVIRGRGCPIAAATANHPHACLIAESLLTEIIGAPVKECCQRGPNPSCCFGIA